MIKFSELIGLLKFNLQRKYKNEPFFVDSAQIIPSNCNAIEFRNPQKIAGVANTVTATINLRDLPPGNSWSIAGGKGEIDLTQYKVSFDAAGGVLIVTRKYYQ